MDSTDIHFEDDTWQQAGKLVAMIVEALRGKTGGMVDAMPSDPVTSLPADARTSTSIGEDGAISASLPPDRRILHAPRSRHASGASGHALDAVLGREGTGCPYCYAGTRRRAATLGEAAAGELL